MGKSKKSMKHKTMAFYIGSSAAAPACRQAGWFVTVFFTHTTVFPACSYSFALHTKAFLTSDDGKAISFE
jgi:hypothetical protein